MCSTADEARAVALSEAHVEKEHLPSSMSFYKEGGDISFGCANEVQKRVLACTLGSDATGASWEGER